MSNEQLDQLLVGVDEETAQQVTDINEEARAKSLSYAFASIAVLGGLGLAATTRLPKREKSTA